MNAAAKRRFERRMQQAARRDLYANPGDRQAAAVAGLSPEAVARRVSLSHGFYGG